MLKIRLLFNHLQTLRVNNSRILRIKDVKFSGYCIYLNTNIWVDFQICISVPCALMCTMSNLPFFILLLYRASIVDFEQVNISWVLSLFQKWFSFGQLSFNLNGIGSFIVVLQVSHSVIRSIFRIIPNIFAAVFAKTVNS